MLNRVKNAMLTGILCAAIPALATAQRQPIELGIDAIALEVDIVSAFGQSVTLTTVSAPLRTLRVGFL